MDIKAIWARLQQADPDHLRPTRTLAKQKIMVALVGLMAMWLAFGVVGLDRYHAPACARYSISHYFYEPWAGTFFVISLAFLGAFMIAFVGETRLDGRLASLGGIGALTLALFPAAGVGCIGELVDFRPGVVATVPEILGGGLSDVPDSIMIPGQDAKLGTDFTQKMHRAGAGALFLVLLYFSAVVFPRIDPHDDLTDPSDPKSLRRWKRFRIWLYRTMTALMAVGVAMILTSQWGWSIWLSEFIGAMLAQLPWAPDFAAEPRPVYHGEMLALSAFGLSWLIHGRSAFSILTGQGPSSA